MATKIQLNTTYTGHSTYIADNFWHNQIGEFDYYKFTLDKPSQVTLSMKNHQDYTWSFKLQDSNNKTFIDADTEKGVKVTNEKIAYTNQSVSLSAGTYYVQVHGNDWGMEHIPYTISVKKIIPLTVNKVSNKTTTVTGKTEAKASVEVKLGSKLLGKATADSKGNYKVKIKAQKAGTKLTVVARDKAKNAKALSVTVVDQIAPTTLTVNKVTSKTTTVTGKTEAKANIEVKLGSKLLGKATADSKGNYKVKIKAQKKGTKLTVIARDKAKNAKTVTTTVK